MSEKPPTDNPPPEKPPESPSPDTGFKPDASWEDPSDLERLYGDHIWGKKTKKSTLIRWLWYPLWDLTTGDFKQWYFGQLPKEARMKIVADQARGILLSPDFEDLPQRDEVLGRDKEISIFLTSIHYHILRDANFLKMRKPPPKVFLVKGEPGSGKTHLIKTVMKIAFAKALKEGFLLDLKQVKFSQLTSEYVGVQTRNTQNLFNKALTKPTFMFIDEANAMVQKGATSGEAATREYQATESVVLQSLDVLARRPVRSIVVLSSNTAENIREDIRRRCFLLDLDNPGLNRQDMVAIIARNLKKYKINLNEEEVASTLEKALRELGEGKMVPHDIERAFDIVVTESEKPIRESAEEGVKKGVNIKPLPIILDSFKACAKDVRAYKLQSMVASVKEAEQSLPPSDRYDDVGGLEDVKEDVINEIHLSLHPEEAGEAWLPPRGYLFYGPPGTGKTLLAKAICGEEKVHWFYIKGPSLLAKWVGESEQGVRDLFKAAKSKSPSIIFVDEIDALGTARGNITGDSGVHTGVLTTLLSELDGCNPLGKVIFIGSTNRKDQLDVALLERLDKQFMFSNPKTTAEKLDVIRAQMRKYCNLTVLQPDEIYKVFLRRTSSPRVMHDTIEAAARLAMTEQIACRKLVRAIDEMEEGKGDPTDQKRIRKSYRKAFSRIQEYVMTTDSEEGFSLVEVYRAIAAQNPITIKHLERAYTDKFETEETKMQKKMSEMHRSKVGMPGKGYGLWATDTGEGGIGVVECLIFPAAEKTKGQVKVYGNVGKGVLESAEMARDFLRNYCSKLADLDISLHFISAGEGSEGVAVSGPSAGQVLTFTLLSALIREPFNPEVCMTGKIDLNGIAGMVGGVQPKQNTGKLDAARAYGFKKILIPQQAYDDIEKEFPDYLIMSKEQGTEIIGGATSWDYARLVFPQLTKEQVLERLSKA